MKTPIPLILASTSKYRAQLLSQLGWDFTCEKPDVDEDAQKMLIRGPHKLCETLAIMKAQAIASKHPKACVIGSDQVCTLEGQILSKPGTHEKAHEQLSRLQGKTHELMTGVAIVTPEKTISFVNRTQLHMRALSASEIEAYLKEDSPLDCAGSYKLESRGIKLFTQVEMTDHTAIIGLPLIQVSNELIKLGFPI